MTLYVTNYKYYIRTGLKHLKPNINLKHSNISSIMVNFIFNDIDIMANVDYLHNQSKINEDRAIRAIFI